MARHFRKADSVISSIYEDTEQDIETIEIQEYRSQNRKIRYNLLPIIISILKDCPHESNLFDLAMRYDKYKNKSIENSVNIESIINQAVFSQSRSNINPYESQIKFKELNSSELRKDSRSMMKITIDLLKQTYEKQNEQLNDLNKEKQLIKENISAYFNEKLDDDGYLQRSINQYNYNGNEQQEYFQQLNKLQLPQLQDQRNSLQQTINEQQIQMDNLRIIMDEYEQVQNQFTEQNEYLQQLVTAKQQLDKQVQSIKVKIQYMMLEYENIRIEENIDKFKALDLPKDLIHKFIELIERSKYYNQNDTPTSFRKILNFESMVEINMDNQEIKQLENQYENKVKQLIEQYEQKKQNIQKKKQQALIEQTDLQLIQQKRQVIDDTLKLTLKLIEQRKLDMDPLEKEQDELLYQQRLMKDKIEWLSGKK